MLEKLKAFKYLNNSYNNMYVITCQITMIVECRVYCLNDKGVILLIIGKKIFAFNVIFLNTLCMPS